ncbi:Dabb family protein [Domibacillus indicus]|uniref:Dabb family protein n=1 Tax=Domibacillus indicus TaxID=1437523 RepID=UPI000617E327|nr:Dabb family protein [Domibacillus indicus]
MYEHLVSFKFKEDVTIEKQQELALKILALKGKVPGAMDVTAGVNTTEETENIQGYTFGMRITFKDKESLDNYLPHPLHQEILSTIEGMIDNVIVVDYEVAW